MVKLAVIGGGPAGLRVAELASAAGISVHLYEQKRSVGRKFLVAGKSGLNLTNAATRDDFLSVYQGSSFPAALWAEIYDHFDNTAVRDWAHSLGQETFVSSGKKVFPESMKAAPLLRRWVEQIRAQGAAFHLNHSFQQIEPKGTGYELTFETAEGLHVIEAEQVVFALGGGSWPKTGSDGGWVGALRNLGVPVDTLEGANCGWELDWPSGFLAEFEGTPWKNLVCHVGEQSLTGELVITRYGLEGGPIYRLGHALRQQGSQATLTLDFKASFSSEQLLRKAESVRKNLPMELAQRWKLPGSVIALLEHRFPAIFAQEKVSLSDLETLSQAVKEFPLELIKARPIEEAISSAGGVRWEALDHQLALRDYPGVFACGEMLDWEAPTGGYLLQGCLSSASWVARSLKG